MFLNNNEITSLLNSQGENSRKAYYNLSIESIILDNNGKKIFIDNNEAILNPGEIAVICTKSITLNNNQIAFLFQKNEFCRKGVLALYDNIAHPGYRGKLSSYIINFSKKPICLRINDHIFEMLVYQNQTSFDIGDSISDDDYKNKLMTDSENLHSSFLGITNIEEKIISKTHEKLMPKSFMWFIGIFATLFTIITAMGFALSVYDRHKFFDYISSYEQIEKFDNAPIIKLNHELELLRKEVSELRAIKETPHQSQSK